MSYNNYKKFSVSMPESRKQQVEDRIKHTAFSEDRSSVIDRDLGRFYDGILKHGLKTLRQARFSPEERACIGSILMSTAFMEPAHIPLLTWSIEDSEDEMYFHEVDPVALLAKIRSLDLPALYALVDLVERDPDMRELA